MSIINTQFNEIIPLNVPANAEYSHRNGSSIIQFQIPMSPTLLDCRSVRLNGKLRLNAQKATNFNSPNLPDNSSNKSGALIDMKLNSRCGVSSLFENITISSLGSGNQTLESVRSLGRLMSLTHPLTHTQEEYDTYLNGSDPSMSSKNKVGAVCCNTETHFSIPINTGLLQGNDFLPIGMNGLRGIEISIQLTNDANSLISLADGTSGQTGLNANMFPSLLDLSLSYDLHHFDAETTQKMSTPSSGELDFNSYAQQTQVLNSNDSTLTFNFGTRKTLSSISSFIPTTSINNINQDSFSTDRLKNINAGVYSVEADLKRLTVSKDGVRAPIDFEIETDVQAAADRPQVERIELLKGAMNSDENENCLVSVNTENGIKTKLDIDGNEVFSLDKTISVEPDAKPLFGVGINLDPITQVGRDYSTSTFNLRIESGLDGKSPIHMSNYSLSKNTLMYSPEGVSVSS